jgi:hypothetical protein
VKFFKEGSLPGIEALTVALPHGGKWGRREFEHVIIQANRPIFVTTESSL